jgi:hypothetical protein
VVEHSEVVPNGLGVQNVVEGVPHSGEELRQSSLDLLAELNEEEEAFSTEVNNA